LKSPCKLDDWSPKRNDTNRKFGSPWGLWRESEAFLRRQAATVFENSTACVKRRDLTLSLLRVGLNKPVCPSTLGS
jgi:hypothetical protein